MRSSVHFSRRTSWQQCDLDSQLRQPRPWQLVQTAIGWLGTLLAAVSAPICCSCASSRSFSFSSRNCACCICSSRFCAHHKNRIVGCTATSQLSIVAIGPATGWCALQRVAKPQRHQTGFREPCQHSKQQRECCQPQERHCLQHRVERHRVDAVCARAQHASLSKLSCLTDVGLPLCSHVLWADVDAKPSRRQPTGLTTRQLMGYSEWKYGSGAEMMCACSWLIR